VSERVCVCERDRDRKELEAKNVKPSQVECKEEFRLIDIPIEVTYVSIIFKRLNANASSDTLFMIK